MKNLIRAEQQAVRLAAGSGRTSPGAGVLDKLRADPLLPFARLGMVPDPWQVEFLRSTALRESLLCCRQAGKSTVTAARVLREALLRPFSDCLVFTPTLRQSIEMLRKVRAFYDALGRPVEEHSDTKTMIEFANGSRVVSLPDSEKGIVGFSAPRIIVIDEGARVSEELYNSVRPMLATGGGSLITLSTPYGNQGWFFRIWDDTAAGVARRARLKEQWRRTDVPASKVARITPDFLADELIEMGSRWFRQEYELAFLDAIDSVFAQSVIVAARRAAPPDPTAPPAIRPLFEFDP